MIGVEGEGGVSRALNAAWLRPFLFLILIVVAWDMAIRLFKIPAYQIPAPGDVVAVLEGAYEKIRAEERGLDLEQLDPPEAIRRLIDFTWNYFLRNPEFLALLNTENLARAQHLKRSTKVKLMHSPFVEMIRTVVRRGVEAGDFPVEVDPVQLYISIAALSFFYLSNSATLSVFFGRDLLAREAKDERLDHMVALVLAALTGKSSADFGRNKMPRFRVAADQTA